MIENITNWFSDMWQAFTALEWYVHLTIGAVLLIMVLLLFKWINNRVRGVVITLKIIVIIAIIVAIVVYFMNR